MTPKQQRFIDEYLVDLNATQAAIRAGYSVDAAKAIGCENLTKPDIQDAIAKRRSEITEKLHISQEKVLSEYAKLAFCNTLDYVRVTDEGDAVIDLSKLTRDQAAAITELTVEDYMDGRGDEAREVKRIKFKLADKKGALDSIAKHLGMFTERIDVRMVAGQIKEQVKGLDDSELLAIIARGRGASIDGSTGRGDEARPN